MKRTLRILSLTNSYPPYEVGGYEQLAADVSDRLRQRGHQVQVFTGVPPAGQPEHCGPVHYVLYPEVDLSSRQPAAMQFFLHWRRRAAHNVRCLQGVLAEFAPQTVLVWNMRGMHCALLETVERAPGVQTVYYSAGYSPWEPTFFEQFWSGFAQRHRRMPGSRLFSRVGLHVANRRSPQSLQLNHVLCVSDYVRRTLVGEGLLPPHSRVVHNGIDLEQFPMRQLARGDLGRPLRLLCAGRLCEEKGVHIAVQAMAELAARFGSQAPKLDIYGGGRPEYERYLSELVQHLNLERFVEVHGWVPRERMPAILQQSDILLFPVVWNEPLARIVQEAMATGVVVVGTLTGGTGEIVCDGYNGLVVPVGDAHSLATCVIRLARDLDLRDRLAIAARHTVESEFSIERMVDQVETYLAGTIAAASEEPRFLPCREQGSTYSVTSQLRAHEDRLLEAGPDERWRDFLDYLRCPNCLGVLRADAPDALTCTACQHRWPIVGGMPWFSPNDQHYHADIPEAQMRALIEDAWGLGWFRAFQRMLSHLEPTKRHVIRRNVLDPARSLGLSLLPLRKDSQVLDLGCGWGTLSLPLAESAGSVVAMDLAPLRARFTQLRACQQGLTNLIVVGGGDTRHLPFDSNLFDAAVLNGVLEWTAASRPGRPWSIQRECLCEVCRVLKPGGLTLIGIENRLSHLYLRGSPEDHIELPYIALLPRRIADWYALQSRGTRYRTHTYTLLGYRRLLTGSGFTGIRFFYPHPDYRLPSRVIPLDNRAALRHAFAMSSISRSKRTLVRGVFASGLFKFIVHSYLILASKPGS